MQNITIPIEGIVSNIFNCKNYINYAIILDLIFSLNNVYSISCPYTNSKSLYDEIYKDEKNEESFGYNKLRLMERCTREWTLSDREVLSCSKIVEDFRFLLHAETYNLIRTSFENFESNKMEDEHLNTTDNCRMYLKESDYVNHLLSADNRSRPGTILKKMFIQDQQCLEKQSWEERALIFNRAYTR